MGSCFSSSTIAAASAPTTNSLPTAKVINLDGTLMEYSQTVKVSHVLGLNKSSSCFVCNADSIFYGQFIQALGSDRFIELGHLYFVLPPGKLEYRLTVADMVELAVSASSAFVAVASTTTARSRGRTRRRRTVAEVMPIVETMDFDCYKRINEFSVGSLKYGLGEKKSVARSSKSKVESN
ncbi:uncharacterized protein LOC110092550 [Dendrobium catenatum]|uniref:Uncharacterized protein n=1 Tax=Dendrobium catenatum TaxID=906689 RepID=A0A2I0XI63_9ASPA|nr:uncharacterized protein LOC110092550 [Dendrobium catenatum]PKU87589.1 hypothetical protein MA16_Dca022870 [Dendrobium catenatum]